MPTANFAAKRKKPVAAVAASANKKVKTAAAVESSAEALTPSAAANRDGRQVLLYLCELLPLLVIRSKVQLIEDTIHLQEPTEPCGRCSFLLTGRC